MNLTHLNIHHVRNISSGHLRLNPRFNIIAGANGSGKTSILEAIYLLGTGHSFRTREIAPLIQHDKNLLTVFARTSTDETVSVQKSVIGPTLIQINKQPCRSTSESAHYLPCQVFYQDIFQIIDAGPSMRRALLDWGVFHVKHDYHLLLKDYRRVLKQRNALLRQKAAYDHFNPWDKQFVELAHRINTSREQYFKQWEESFQYYLHQLADIDCSLKYDKGWDRRNEGANLALVLKEQFSSDRQRQYTQSGAHQADIHIQTNNKFKSKLFLSRGQQKIILIALKLAQAQLLDKPCLYLMDDIAAELDSKHLEKLFRCLDTIKGQFFITAISTQLLSNNISKLDNQIIKLANGELDVSM